MRAIAALSVLLLPLVILVHPPTSAQARSTAQTCSTWAYSAQYCTRVPPRGRFAVVVPREPVVLYGFGNPADAGTIIFTAPVATPCPGHRVYGFRLSSNGPFPSLRLASAGMLYAYDPGTDSCARISQITSPGIYEIVLPGGAIGHVGHASTGASSRQKTSHGKHGKGH